MNTIARALKRAALKRAPVIPPMPPGVSFVELIGVGEGSDEELVNALDADEEVLEDDREFNVEGEFVDDVELSEDIRAVKVDREFVVEEEDTIVLDTVLDANIGVAPVTTIVIKLLELEMAAIASAGVAYGKRSLPGPNVIPVVGIVGSDFASQLGGL
jgi:hypothetical protein